VSGTKRRGVALIIVLSVLALLCMLGVSLVTLQTLEQSTTRAYGDMVQARLVARSGMEHGYVMLQQMVDRELQGLVTEPGHVPPFRALRYYGNDVLEKGDDPNLLTVPLDQALNPSMALEVVGETPEKPQNPLDPNFRPARVRVDGKVTGLSGYLESSRYGYRSDVYSLRITDLSGLLHVNDGVGENARHGSVTRNLLRLLNRLGDVLKVEKLGDRIVQSRPPQGYASRTELEEILGSKDYEKAGQFLTVYAWVDRSVIQPVPLSDSRAVIDYYTKALGTTKSDVSGPYYRGSPAAYRYGRGRNSQGNLVPGELQFAPEAADPAGEDHAIWGVDELNPQWIEVCARAPVNLNSAPKEVLTALLADLQGFWMAERRRNHPNISNASDSARTWNNSVVQSLDSSGSDGDAMGYLYTTDKITFTPGGATQSGQANSASAIAAEIIACREGRESVASRYDYDRTRNPKAWFGGPFRTWRQFNAFCDHLVTIGLVRESRAVFHQYPSPGDDITGGGNLQVSGLGDALAAIASQAIADTIKANFNPNCHLNEANPDENMALLVDKTDLIVMSTEGCFLPSGYFEVESFGRVLRPVRLQSGSSNTTTASQEVIAIDALRTPDNRLMAEAWITGIVQLYDQRRFTTQKDFHAGEITRRDTLPETNNGLSVEIGPEPDNGAAPAETEWGGYLALPTNGGSPWAASPGGPAQALPKPPGAIGYTPNASESEIDADSCTLHAHFTHDTRLHHAHDQLAENLATSTGANENVENRPDRTETQPGPYDATLGSDPVTGKGGNRHRLARSFRLPDAQSEGKAPAQLVETAPLDLRIDGVYLERDANLGYWISPDSLGGHKFMLKFVASFWMKPNFHPEVSGKPRLLWNAGRAELRKNLWDFFTYPVEPGMLDLYFCPSQNAGVELTPFNGTYTNWYPARPASLLFMHSASYMTNPTNFGGSLCYALCVATQTKALNHHHHTSERGWSEPHPGVVTEPGESGYRRDNPLAAHRWMHVTVACTTNWGSPTPDARIWVNGKSSVQMPASPRWGVYALGLPTSTRIDWTYNFHDDNSPGEMPYADKNLLRFGQPHRVTMIEHANQSPYTTRHNYSCDSTIDEFQHFVGWTPVTEGAALAQWRRGRYHLPRAGEEGQYTSKPISLLLKPLRRMAPAAGGRAPATGKGTQAETPAKTGAVAESPSIRLLGAAWTLIGETVDPEDPHRAAQMVDYNTVDQPDPDMLTVRSEFYLETAGEWHGPFVRDDFSGLADERTGERPQLTDPGHFRFRFRFRWKEQPPTTAILLATPYIDDVTIFYETRDCGFIAYQLK